MGGKAESEKGKATGGTALVGSYSGIVSAGSSAAMPSRARARLLPAMASMETAITFRRSP